MAAEIRRRFPKAKVDLIASSRGRFEVVANGLPVFEKSKLGRHARPGEVVELLERAGDRGSEIGDPGSGVEDR